MKALKFIALFVGSLIVSYLLWLFFHWATPHLMSISKFWHFLAFIFIAEPILVGIAFWISSLAAVLLNFLSSELSRLALLFATSPFIFNGFFAAKLPWGLDMDYNVVSVLMAISLMGTYIWAFVSVVYYIAIKKGKI